VKKLQTLCISVGHQLGNAGDVAAWAAKAINKARCDRVAGN
jgi:hypothetical protein